MNLIIFNVNNGAPRHTETNLIRWLDHHRDTLNAIRMNKSEASIEPFKRSNMKLESIGNQQAEREVMIQE